MSKHALVFGATGITGWAVVNQLLSDYPQSATFSRVTAICNRPISMKETLWPDNAKLNLVSGIDLLKGSQEELEKVLRDRVTAINTVSHVYFHSYKWSADKTQEIHTNTSMLERAIRAVETLGPNLEFVTLPTGTKAYGTHLLSQFPFSASLPLRETLPRIPSPHASQLFYYAQVDTLRALGAHKAWRWCELRPDMVVGFVPNGNAHCLAQILAIYLSLYAHVNGTGSKVPFPGNAESWTIRSNDSSQDTIARFAIYTSLLPHAAPNKFDDDDDDDTSTGRAFNVADRAVPSSWSRKWPVICAWFGLRGIGPVVAEQGGEAEAAAAPQPLSAYVREHRREWDRLAQTHGLKDGVVDNELMNPGFQHYIMSSFTFDRYVALDAMREVGFGEECDEGQAWGTAFERFRRARIIP